MLPKRQKMALLLCSVATAEGCGFVCSFNNHRSSSSTCGLPPLPCPPCFVFPFPLAGYGGGRWRFESQEVAVMEDGGKGRDMGCDGGGWRRRRLLLRRVLVLRNKAGCRRRRRWVLRRRNCRGWNQLDGRCGKIASFMRRRRSLQEHNKNRAPIIITLAGIPFVGSTVEIEHSSDTITLTASPQNE